MLVRSQIDTTPQARFAVMVPAFVYFKGLEVFKKKKTF
jgi:hypothetical protein